MYREVTMIDVREVLRLRAEGLPKKRIAAQLGLDPKTVRRYLGAAQQAGVRVTATISGEEVRQGVEIAYATLHRFAVLELQFGKTATTIPVLDGEPGQELQLDTGWVGSLTLPQGKKRRFRAWIFTAVRSRHRFVYPTFEETTARAIEACEAAWAFVGGIFKVLIPDNTAAIVLAADPLAPRITPAFSRWSDPKVGRDQLVAVDKALYAIPHPYVGQRITARADARALSPPGHAIQTAPGGRGF